MAQHLMNTQEVAQYLGIHEKQVYALIKAGRIPATRATGKWLFIKRMIDEWLEMDAKAGLKQARRKSGRISGALLAAGSNDPVLDILITILQKRHPEFYVFSSNIGSVGGLAALNDGHVDIAWSHLWDPVSDSYNIPFLPRCTPNIQAVVVHLFRRELGIFAAPGNPLGISSLEDLRRKGIRLVNRQLGAGTRLLLDHHLERLGITPADVAGYDTEAFTHFEVGHAILTGEADIGLGTVAMARLLNLHFVPLTLENFDMIVDKERFFQEGIQAVLETLHSTELRQRTVGLGNYDFNASGSIVHAGT